MQLRRFSLRSTSSRRALRSLQRKSLTSLRRFQTSMQLLLKRQKCARTRRQKNAATIQEATEAQTAVSQALTVLREFYAKAAKATALVQQPAMPDTPYQGMGGSAGGVVGMLEVIESDFARVQ